MPNWGMTALNRSNVVRGMGYVRIRSFRFVLIWEDRVQFFVFFSPIRIGIRRLWKRRSRRRRGREPAVKATMPRITAKALARNRCLQSPVKIIYERNLFIVSVLSELLWCALVDVLVTCSVVCPILKLLNHWWNYFLLVLWLSYGSKLHLLCFRLFTGNFFRDLILV